jgi:hypothetical protein
VSRLGGLIQRALEFHVDSERELLHRAIKTAMPTVAFE